MKIKMLATCFSLFAFGVGAAHAQPTTPASIQVQLTNDLAAPPASVEVSESAFLVTILRINTPLNEATHALRNQEAEKIALMVSPAIKGLANAEKIIGIHVEYVKRSGASKHAKLVDRVEFRESPDGSYTLHKT